MQNIKRTKYILTACMIALLMLCFAVRIIETTDTIYSSAEKNGIVILIDPGHGGKDPGATGATGAKESILNMQVALLLREYLLENGYGVIMTRGDDGVLGADTWLSSADRKKKISETQCDMVISIHMNKFTDASVHGAEVHYHPQSESGKRLAEYIQASIKNELDPQNTRKAKASDNLFTLKTNPAPSVLVECGYISNPEEEQKLSSSVYQKRTAFAIYCGISKYFST